ncbi:epidermal growth factor receptor kinase substrate 8-like protein 1 [Clonorchis sinensis]|uniref:Epidermal growth factor receptor kinase substrate 8-like protein 1 n=1 Tax=Clonorchis sinensis TaxID=79923 RepID=H2KPD7_CLOSI|nr:epidermal growth factor receptor kinase substrate 8-like protein 1 [Clonorchis sinensis]
MLNRCIDDIEHFERRLEKALKKRGSPAEDIHNQSMATAPASHELIDVVRKVKYAFNTNEAIRPYTPERTSKKLFIRLFNTVQWLDEVCRSGFIPEYDRNMVANVAEPYLNAETISAITERLGAKRQEFWRSLGPNWTTPSEQISNQKERYIPNFDAPVQDSSPQHQPHHGQPVRTDYQIEQILIYSTLGQVTRTPSSGSVVIATNKKQGERKVARNRQTRLTNNRSVDLEFWLYYATVRHVGSKPKEISVSPGTILEVLDSTDLDWWTVRDQNGAEGEIPRWKLQESPVRARTPEQDPPLRQSPVVSNTALKHQSLPPIQVQGPNVSGDSDVDAAAEASKASEPSSSKRQQNASGSMSMDLSQPTKSPSPQTVSHSHLSVPQGNMIYMTAEQIQELLKSPNRNAQLPVVIVPINELQNYTSQTSISSGVNGNMGCFDNSVPMRWPELNEMREPMMPARLPSPPILSSYGGAPLATHMHTMTRELRERLSKMREGGGTGLRSVPSPTTTSDRPYGRLTKYSSKEDVAEWLVAHSFPPNDVTTNLMHNKQHGKTMQMACASYCPGAIILDRWIKQRTKIPAKDALHANADWR